jgi:hypothetical protein
MDSVVISEDGTIKKTDKLLQEFGNRGDNLQISNEKGIIVLKPIFRLNDLKGAFPIKGWKEELKNIRDEWSNRTDEVSSF